jgi:hypothetical protein
MSDYSDFVDDVFDVYLGNAWKQYSKEMKMGVKHTERIKVNGNRGLSGNLLELVLQRIAETLGEKARLTGASGQKADLVITEITAHIPDSLAYGLQSVRADFVK